MFLYSTSSKGSPPQMIYQLVFLLLWCVQIQKSTCRLWALNLQPLLYTCMNYCTICCRIVHVHTCIMSYTCTCTCRHVASSNGYPLYMFHSLPLMKVGCQRAHLDGWRWMRLISVHFLPSLDWWTIPKSCGSTTWRMGHMTLTLTTLATPYSKGSAYVG